MSEAFKLLNDYGLIERALAVSQAPSPAGDGSGA